MLCRAAGEGLSHKVASEQRAGGREGKSRYLEEDGFRRIEQPKQNPQVGVWVAFFRNEETTVAIAKGKMVGDEVT